MLGDLYRTAYQPECAALDPIAYLDQPRHPQLIDGREYHPTALVAAMLQAIAPATSLDDATTVGVTIAAHLGSRERRVLRQAGELARLPNLAIYSDLAAAVAAGIIRSPDQFRDETILVCHVTPWSSHWGVAAIHANKADVGHYGSFDLGTRDWESVFLDRLSEAIEQQAGEPPYGPLNENMWRRQHQRIAERAATMLATDDVMHWHALCGETIVQGHFNSAHWLEISRPLRDQLTAELQAAVARHQPTKLWLLGACRDSPEWQLQIEQACRLPCLTIPGSTSEWLADGAACLSQWKENGRVAVDDSAAHALGLQTFDRKQKRAFNKIVVAENSRLRGVRSLKIGKVNEPKLSVRLLQGNAQAAEDNVLLGECRVDVQPGDHVQLRLGYDSNGEARVLAQINQGQPQEVPIEDPLGLSSHEADEVLAWLRRIRCVRV